MIVTIAIFSLIMVAIIDSVLFFYRANNSSLEQSMQVHSARRGAELLVQNIREATFADDGSYPVNDIATSSITFFSDTEGDSSVERVSYTLEGTTLFRTITPAPYTGTGATSVVSDYVRNTEEGVSLFRYYDINGDEIVDFSETGRVRSVTIDLVVNIRPVRAPHEFTLRSSATIRNLKSE